MPTCPVEMGGSSDGDNLYCIHFFVSYDESKGSGPGSFEMGIEVYPKAANDMHQGNKFRLSKTSGDDPYIIIGLKSLSMGIDDFEWEGTRINRDGQSDDYVPPSSGELDVNYFREISYTVALRDENTYSPPTDRYGSRIFRCGIDDGHSYSPVPVKGSKDYSFGLRKNGFYSFRGFFWPYNVYRESEVTNVIANPLVKPPANPDVTNSSFRMYGNAVKSLGPTLTYDPHKLNLSLFATFGFTSDNYEPSCALDINTYDQYGHKADLVVDPDMLPREYIEPESENGLCSYKYFSTNHQNRDDPDKDDQSNVFGIFVAKLPESGTYRYIATDETQERCTLILKDTPDDKLPAFDETNLFRPYRSTKTNNALAAEINYGLVSYKYALVEWAVFGPHVVTVPTIQGTSGWRLAPVWINTSFIIYYGSNTKIVTSEYVGGSNVLGVVANPTGSAALEWEFVVCADNVHTGAPDKGQGPNEKAYNTPNFDTGRNYWVTINSLKMSFNGGITAGYIYPNGLNQAEINIEFTPADANGNALAPSQFPTIPYVQSCIAATDYHTGTKFRREMDAPGWDYTFENNPFQKQTATQESIATDYDDIEVSINEDSQIINVKMYVTADQVSANVKDIGLWIGIFDEAWGDPVVYTCKSGNSGGDTSNFDTFVSINLKNAINYTDKDLMITAVNASMPNIDDNWPVSSSGAEVDDNMWRLWNYSIGLKRSIPAFYFAVDTDRYSKDTRCFALWSCGVYTAHAYIWPTGLVDMETGEPISESSNKTFSVDSAYSVKVENSPETEPGKLFMSLYWEFGSGNYSYTKRNYFTIVVYDIYGNSATFNPDPTLVQGVYQESQFTDAHPLNLGPATAKNYSYQNSPDFTLVSNYSKAYQNRYITCQDHNDKKMTYNVVLQHKTSESAFHLTYIPSKAYQFSMVDEGLGDYVLGARYASEKFKMFAGMAQSSRFDFYLRPLWNRMAFVITTSVPDQYTDSMAFTYMEDENPIVAELKVFEKSDDFVWSLEFY
ncbi:hypothetical protein C7374_103334 [Falsochrobactrum ovis]|uniref:Uncharacterized protein n=2 Tax=Falsochrobactrum ovis TaxID=1293442 RepID=A0A364JX27_9HYPH|nr:hypothetical protein C7374_103334 [Falsochrobactrum ovis]